MVIREYLNSSNRMSVRLAAGMVLALCGIIFTTAVMGVLLLALSNSGLAASMIVTILFLVTFPACYFFVAKFPDIKLGDDAFKLFILLLRGLDCRTAGLRGIPVKLGRR